MKMDANDLGYFKNLLLKQRYEILNKADKVSSQALWRQEKNSQGDEGDLAVSELNMSMSLSLEERQAALLSQVDLALAKIDRGNFGICIECEELLSRKRLEARPMAQLCITCQEESEILQKAYA